MSKMKFYKEAETMFLQDNLSVDKICQALGVSRRTIFYWKKEFEWDKKRLEKIRNKEAMTDALQEFVQKLMDQISKDIDSKKQIHQAMFYSLNNLLKFMPDVAQYEQELQKSKEPEKRFPTPEEIRQIEREFLGLDLPD